MRDIPLKDIVAEVAKEFGVPKFIVSYVARYAFKKMYKIIGTNTDRIQLWDCEINAIYPTPRFELCDELADLDETKGLTKKQKKFLLNYKIHEKKKLLSTVRGKLHYSGLPNQRHGRRKVAEKKLY